MEYIRDTFIKLMLQPYCQVSSSLSEWIQWKYLKNCSASLNWRTHPFKSQRKKFIHTYKTIFIVVFIINQEWWAAGEKVRQAVLYNLRGWEEGKGMGGLARFGGLGPCTRARSSAPELNESKTHEMEWMYPLSFYMWEILGRCILYPFKCKKYWVDVSF